MFTYCKGPKEELVVGPATSWSEAQGKVPNQLNNVLGTKPPKKVPKQLKQSL